MYEISYQNSKRVIITMSQFHDWNLHFNDNSDNTFITKNVERLNAQSCYGDITHHFHSQLNIPIRSVCVRTFFNCQRDSTTDIEGLFDQLHSFNFDSVWSIYTFDQITTLIHNIQNILRTQYHIEHSALFHATRKWFLDGHADVKRLDCQLNVSGSDILPHELFFILNIYRRLFTLSNKITNDIVFQLTQNATNTWCNLDAVALLVLFDYFNTYSPNDSLIGYIYLNNLHTLKSFLDANSFSEFSLSVRTENELIDSRAFQYIDLFSAIVNKTHVKEVNRQYNINEYARMASDYGLPSPLTFYNSQYIISLEELLKPTVYTDETIKQIETYIGFLNAIMYNNK